MIARGSVHYNCGRPGSVSDPQNQNLWAWGLGRRFEGAVPRDGVHPAIEQWLACSSQLSSTDVGTGPEMGL